MKRNIGTAGALLAVLFLLSGCGAADQVSDAFYDGLGRVVVGEAEEAEPVSREHYAYQCLGEEEQTVYDQIVQAILDHQEKAVLSTRDQSALERAFSAVLADHGEFFWISGYEYNMYTSGDQVIGFEILPAYTMTREERDAAADQVETISAQWLEGVPAGAGDYEKVKYVFETLISQVEYDLEAPENQNILSVFLHGRTVCQGYAEAAAYLLEKLGVQSAVVTGTAGGEPHAWNLVRMDGEYYYVDVTWGNSNYSSGEGTLQGQKLINYAYLGMTTQELLQTHTPDGAIPVPECTATADNYYRREGLYVETWDPDAVGGIFREGWSQGKGMATVRLADSALYEKTVDYFIRDRRLSDYCGRIGTVHYVEMPEMGILTLQF